MVMRQAALMIAATLALGACSREPSIDEKDASPEEIAQKMRESGRDQSFIRAGLWRSKVTIEQFDMPGMPPEMAERMKAMMAQNQEHDFETCLTPEDVKRPKEDFFAGKNNQCRYEHFKMSGGKIDAAMNCAKDGLTHSMRMAGTYSPESYQMQTAMKASSGKGEEGAMSMTMRIEANRVGECPAKTAQS
jgi:hypothetical protein